jgi:hypothetical protein
MKGKPYEEAIDRCRTGPKRRANPLANNEAKLDERKVFGEREVKWLYFDHGINLLSRTGLATVARRLEAEIAKKMRSRTASTKFSSRGTA